jgi:hypothetical protein
LSYFNAISYVGRLWRPLWKWRTGRNFSMLGINIFRMLNLCSIVVAILKMVTGRNFSMSGIDSGHHNLPTYEMSLKSDNVEFVNPMGKLKFRTLMLITSKWIMIET